MNTISERKEYLLKRPGKELSLAVEGKYTNLRIWVDYHGTVGESKVNPPDTIYMRLDKYQNYSVPFTIDKIEYLEKENHVMEKIASEFGFTSSIDKLDVLLTITKDMKHRECLSW